MATYSDLKTSIDDFGKATGLNLEISGLHDLFPTEKADLAEDCQITGRWPEPWAHARSSGVYAMLDDTLSLLYVGKAATATNLAGRLQRYFTYNAAGGVHLKHPGWSRCPRFVVTVAFPKEAADKAAVLEGRLIDKFNPPDNARGKDLASQHHPEAT